MFQLQTKIEAIKQVNESTAESMLRTQFKMELIVYTQDSTYSHSLCERKREEDEDQPLTEIRSTIFSTDNHATLQEMMLHLKSYYRVSTV